jgi:hypothetical protein
MAGGIWSDPKNTSARGGTGRGGDSAAQDADDSGVRSNPVRLPDYDPDAPGQSFKIQKVIKSISAKVAAAQENNANIGINEEYIATWAQGEIKKYNEYIQKFGPNTTLELADWLKVAGSDFLANLDKKRARTTKANIKQAYDNTDTSIGSGYQLPAPRRGDSDISEAEIDAPKQTREVPTEIERGALDSFRADVVKETGVTFGLEDWAREQLKAYRKYLLSVGRKNSSMTAKEWLKTNLRAERERGGM